VFDRFAGEAHGEGWRYHELSTGHDCHVEMPEAFSRVLVDGDSASGRGDV
jgi:hypothetical protein